MMKLTILTFLIVWAIGINWTFGEESSACFTPDQQKFIEKLAAPFPESGKDISEKIEERVRLITKLNNYKNMPQDLSEEDKGKILFCDAKALLKLLGEVTRIKIAGYLPKMVSLNVPSPAGVRGAAGMKASEIADPSLRAEYEAEIAKRVAILNQNRNQAGLRQLEQVALQGYKSTRATLNKDYPDLAKKLESLEKDMHFNDEQASVLNAND